MCYVEAKFSIESGTRMCAVFSTAENEDASISFEDFLDMASGSYAGLSILDD